MNNTARAAIWMLGAIVSFSLLAVAGRAVSVELDTFELLLYRSVIGLVIVVTVAAFAGTLGQITRDRLDLHLLRNIFHFAGQNLWFYALGVIPLAQVFALEFTSPIWVIVMAPFLLGERLTPRRALSAAIGFAGIMIVARPGVAPIGSGMIAAALAAVGFAATAIFTRKLTAIASVTCILFYLTLMQSVFSLIFAGFDGHIAWPSNAIWPWLGVIALAGLMAHFSLTKALGLAPASIVMPLDFTRLPLIAVVGALFYNEPLSGYVFLGAAVIFVANYINIRPERRHIGAK